VTQVSRVVVALLATASLLAACAGPGPTVTPARTTASAQTTAPAQTPTAVPASPSAGASASETGSPSPAAPSPSAGPWDPPSLALSGIVSGLQRPLWVGGAGDGSGRLFVLEQAGTIRVIRDGRLVSRPYLDIRDRVSSGGERGLLGLAFAPTFARDGRFFVDATDPDGNTFVAEFRAPDPAADTADPASERVILRIRQPFANHNGGGIIARPDGTLWIAAGDGGSGGDPQGNGQRRTTLLGKLLRIDPRAAGVAPYTVPPDNPFAGRADARGEIWALGLRNPWRFSFDRATGDLWIGDVGQDRWEEVDRVRTGDAGGRNFGWNVMEGTHCFSPAAGCDTNGLTLPVAEYDHGQGCAITGGFVYRGAAIPALAGTYLYADSCSGRIWGLEAAAEVPRARLLAGTGASIVSFGEDDAGELYVADVAGGAVSRLVVEP
jgi:glucose/arabinose dehydrogenase